MATIGRAVGGGRPGLDAAVAATWRWLAWLFIHMLYLIAFENRVLVLFQWAWNYFTRNRSARLITGDDLPGARGIPERRRKDRPHPANDPRRLAARTATGRTAMIPLFALDFAFKGFEEAFWQGLWAGAFQLLTLSMIVICAFNIVYQHPRARLVSRTTAAHRGNRPGFTIRLYRPRKMYWRLLDKDHDPLAGIADPRKREACRRRTMERALG